MKQKINKALQIFVVVFIATIFFSLGKWQLDRAAEWKNAKATELKVDQRTYPLDEIAQPSDNLTNEQAYKQVVAEGHYIATFRAPGQIDKRGNVKDWEVGLLEISMENSTSQTDRAILVVRGFWSDRLLQAELAMSSRVTVTGTLQPRQSQDFASAGDGVLQRIDSALVTQFAQGVSLYDGFIAAQGERTSIGEITRTRIEPVFRSAVPGFYWQHISYVAIWWLLALLMLYLPFYNRRITSKVQP